MVLVFRRSCGREEIENSGRGGSDNSELASSSSTLLLLVDLMLPLASTSLSTGEGSYGCHGSGGRCPSRSLTATANGGMWEVVQASILGRG